MRKYTDCPQILRDFLAYHENIKNQSQKTISEYFLDSLYTILAFFSPFLALAFTLIILTEDIAVSVIEHNAEIQINIIKTIMYATSCRSN